MKRKNRYAFVYYTNYRPVYAYIIAYSEKQAKFLIGKQLNIWDSYIFSAEDFDTELSVGFIYYV